MPIKVAILGRPTNIEKFDHYYRLTMLEGGSSKERLGLQPTSQIEITVFISPFQAQQSNVTSIPKNKVLLINGELAIDLDMTICPGELGVIATSVELVDAPAPLQSMRSDNKDEKQKAEVPISKDVTKSKVKPKKIVELIESESDKPQKPSKKSAVSVPDLETKKKPKTKPKQENHSTEEAPTESNKQKSAMPEWLAELHQRQNGICQQCGQHLDIKMARYGVINKKKPESAKNAKLLCPDCLHHHPNPAQQGTFEITPEVIKRIMDNTGWDESTSQRWLYDFLRNYALVMIAGDGGEFRVYWSWVKEEPFSRVIIKDNTVIDLKDFHRKRKPIDSSNV